MEDGNSTISESRVVLILFGVASATVIISLCHCYSLGSCFGQRNRPSPRAQQQRQRSLDMIRDIEAAIPDSMENSVVQLIPAHKHKKGIGIVSDDGMCAVCLCEFEDGEELRILPECMHSYHAECIDMWLFSHTNCPMCRTDAVPLPLATF